MAQKETVIKYLSFDAVMVYGSISVTNIELLTKFLLLTHELMVSNLTKAKLVNNWIPDGRLGVVVVCWLLNVPATC